MALEIFLFINALVIGALIVLGVQHFVAHRRSKKPAATTVHPAEVRLPRDLRDRLIEEAESKFKTLLAQTAVELEKDLKDSAVKMSTALALMYSQTLETQQNNFKTTEAALISNSREAIQRLEHETQSADQQLAEQLAASKAQLEQKLDETIAKRREELLASIDTSFSDSVVSFLIETLGHEVDLGAQTSYIIARLDENKELFKSGVSQ